MGNNGSQNTTITEPHSLDKWVHSYPKTQHPHSKQNYQRKVLPERDAHLKLRQTGNGEILQSGGTISGRQFRLTHELNDTLHRNITKSSEESTSNEEFSKEKDNNREIHLHGVKQKLSSQQKNTTKNYEEFSSNDGKEFSKEKELSRKVFLHRAKQKQSNNASSQQMKYFASEPDLRYACKNVNNNYQDRRLRKKYKAPSPPTHAQGGNNLQTTKEDLLNPGLPIRKARLFKTRAETKKESSHLNETSDDYVNNVNNSNNNKVVDKLKPEIKLSSNEFVKELKDATRKLRHLEIEKENSTNTRTKLNTLDPNVTNTKDLTKKLLLTIEHNSKLYPQCSRGEASGKESTTPDMSPSLSRGLATKDRTTQHFYFGMNKNEVKDAQPTNGMYRNFTTKRREDNSSESDLSSDLESDENDTYRSGIDLQLRPILPKKQLEIPRFSPSVAWRLLSMNNEQTNGTMISDDVPGLLEEHIEKFSRPPPLVNAGQRSTNDKSGDSGISGDGPDAIIPISYCYDDVTSANDTNKTVHTNKIPLKYSNKPERVSWTPQQDLGDDTSTEEDVVNEKTLHQKSRPYLGPHTFSLSLPRDNRLASYMVEKNHMPHYSGMQKFKKSLSGVLGGRKEPSDSSFLEENNANWFLSKSAPNSLTHTFHSLERYRMEETEELLYPPNVNAASRLIYLPEIDLEKDKPRHFKNKFSVYSKSCEDISLEVENNRPQPLQDPAVTEDFSWKLKLEKKPKKYTFQSTIRQIEKKRLSDKLSREAEKRERKRLREMEAMQKVEEDFQKKRAREKANIRNQLRLFSLDESAGWNSLPPNFEIDHKDHRSEPDGALSSISSSSSSVKNNSRTQEFVHSKMSKSTSAYTRELSEYRQPHRSYKDYNSNIKYTPDKGYNRQTTIHPQVSYNMPKAKGSKTKQGHNYRKEFATGRRVLSIGSTHSEDSQNFSTKRDKLTGSGRSYNRHLVSS